MLTERFVPGRSAVHRASPALKIVTLFATCTLLFVMESGWVLGGAALVLAALYALARVPLDAAIEALRPAAIVLAVIFLVQLHLAGLELAAFVTLRFVVMILAASLLTLTTRTGALVEAIEAALRRLLGRDAAEAVGLAFSLCLRFVPRVRATFEEVREAQRARGLERDWRALAVPTIVRTLKSADEIAQAIAARSIEPGEAGAARDEKRA